jgi:mono/diheme cytochrome c family protein
MPVAREKLHELGRAGLILADVIVAVLLLVTAALIVLENRWTKPTFRGKEGAFQHGTIGTELMPLAVALVLPDLFPENFQPGGKQAGDWIEQFGFIRNDDPKVNEGLPVGFAASRYRPQSGSPSPAAFVGFSCALCHSTVIRTDTDQHGKIFYGPGSNSLNLFAWLDAFQASMLAREPLLAGTSFDPDNPPPYRLTSNRIVDAYEAKTGRKLGLLERGMIALWLRQIRTRLEDGLPRFDEPFGQGRSRDPQVTPTGPTRTQPFRTLIRTVFDRPGNDMPVYTKIATVFSEDLRKHSQFDGSIANLHARSSLAALAAGATVENMSLPEIADNIRKASDYTVTLRPPRYADLFPQQPAADAARLARGSEVYRQHCYGCHGGRDPATGSWQNGPKVGEVVPLGIIKTDPERVMFRHYGDMGDRLFRVFPEKHPFHFPRDEISPRPGEEENIAIRGYVNAPMDGMFLRAPYLHNASVLTLAELINLKKRRDVFYRGHNRYDPVDAGYRSPDAPDRETYFKFDTSIRGNSNKGHDFPWAYDDPNRNVDDLTALLDYLKTL